MEGAAVKVDRRYDEYFRANVRRYRAQKKSSSVWMSSVSFPLAYSSHSIVLLFVPSTIRAAWPAGQGSRLRLQHA